MTNSDLHKRDQQHYLKTFGRFPVAIEKGRGSRVWDVEGKEYIDALAGIAVNNVGHCHPKIVDAIKEQAATLMHISNFFVNKPQVELSEKLTRLSGMARAFFTNSGAESVEGAIKIARKYAHSIGRGGTIVSFHGSFHGRTMATIATGKPKMQAGFEPIPSGFNQVPFNDIDAVKAIIDEDIAALLIEPIQGEGGVNVADKNYLHELKAICEENNIVLIFDEVQCGMGRTGHYFAKDYFGIQPDIMTLAKALGNGVPIGAILSNDKVSEPMQPGDHGTTFGGNPLVCAAALATLEVLEQDNLLKEATEKGAWLKNEFTKMNDPSIKEVRGLGLMIGVEFNFLTKPLVVEMLKNGVIANATADNVLRLVPPLNITYEELEAIMICLKKSLKTIKEHV